MIFFVVCALASAQIINCAPDCDGVDTTEHEGDDLPSYSYDGLDMSKQSHWDELFRSWSGCKSVKRIVINGQNSIKNFDEVAKIDTLNKISIGIGIGHNQNLTSIDGLKNITEIQNIAFFENPLLTDISALGNVPSAFQVNLNWPIDPSGLKNIASLTYLYLDFYKASFLPPDNLKIINKTYITHVFGREAALSAIEVAKNLNILENFIFNCMAYSKDITYINDRVKEVEVQHNLVRKDCTNSGQERLSVFNGCGAFEENPESLRYYLTGEKEPLVDEAGDDSELQKELYGLKLDCP